MKSILYLMLAISVGASLHACRNTSEVATNGNGDMINSDIREGKVIFAKDCARCHEQKKVEDYTAAQWENILTRMIIQAELDEIQSQQVKAYVEWELENN